MKRLAIVLLAIASCQTAAPLARRFDAPPENVRGAVLAALEAGGEVTREGDTYETYWRADDAARASARASVQFSRLKAASGSPSMGTRSPSSPGLGSSSIEEQDAETGRKSTPGRRPSGFSSESRADSDD